MDIIFFRNTAWTNLKTGDKVTVMTNTDQSSLDVDPYACVTTIKHRYFDAYMTVGHISREISLHYFYCIKQSGVTTGHLVSAIYKTSPVPVGALEIPLLQTVLLEQKRIHEMVKDFVGILYDYNYCAQKAINDQIDDDIDNEIIVSVE